MTSYLSNKISYKIISSLGHCFAKIKKLNKGWGRGENLEKSISVPPPFGHPRVCKEGFDVEMPLQSSFEWSLKIIFCIIC